MTKISILLPVYNGEKYLKKTLDSILNQTFPDFELIIIDDKSLDNSLDVINNIKDPRIKLIKNIKNLGQSESQNIGLVAAKGLYIARIDQDDIMHKDRLKIQNEYLDNHKDVVLFGCQYQCIDENDEFIYELNWPVGFKNIIYSLITGYCVIGDSPMIRKKILNKIGGYKSSFIPSEDYELLLRLISKGYKINNCPEYLMKYRIHPNQISKINKMQQDQKHLIAFENFLRVCGYDKIKNYDIESYLKVFNFKRKVSNKNLDQIFIIYNLQLKYLSRLFGLEYDKNLFICRLINFIGKNYKNIKLSCLIKAIIKNKISIFEAKRPLFLILMAKFRFTLKTI